MAGNRNSFEKIMFCHLCGQTLTRRAKLIHHPHWPAGHQLRVCLDCDCHKPRCRACDIPMASPSPNGLCLTCVEHIPLCRTCNQPIIGRSWEVSGSGPYCEDCRNRRPPCDICGAPLSERRWELSDGRVFCESCYAVGIFTPRQANALYYEVKAVVARTLGLSLNIPTGLVLVDREQLAEIIQLQSNGAPALEVGRIMGIYARKGMRRGIYVQTGLPRPLFLQVAAHEYAHAWQGENCPLLRNTLVHEGFAEWLAYRVMAHYGYDSQMKRMQARDDIYGRGLSWALNLEAREGAAGVLAACRKAR